MMGIKHVTPTHLQQLMLTGQKMSPDSPLYNMAFRFDIFGKLDTDKFIAAFDSVVQKNDCLRMRLSSDGGLTITEEIDIGLSCKYGDPGTELTTRACIALDLSAGFFDSTLYCVNDQHHIWYINQHHIITDGAAFIQFFRSIESAYQGSRSNPGCSFEEFRQSELEAVLSPEFQSASEFWDSRSKSYHSERQSFHTETERNTVELSTDTMSLLSQAIAHPGIRSISRDLSTFSVLAATLLILRYRLFSTTDSTLGTPFHNRRHASFLGPELEIGLIRVDLAKFTSFLEIVQQIQSDVLTAMKHSLPGISSATINNSFSWLLNYVSREFGDFADLKCKTEWLHPNAGDAAHVLRVQAHDFNHRGRLTLHFDLAVSQFSLEQRQRLPEIFERLLRQCLTEGDAPFIKHSLLDKKEIDNLADFNNTVCDTPLPSVLDLFYKQVSQNPDADALSDNSHCLSYQDLNQHANAVAKYISELDVIPMLIGRSLNAVVTMLAAMKIGRPFIPLDIQHPNERINTILDELGNPPLVTTANETDRPLRSKRLILVDQIKNCEDDTQEQLTGTEDSAYIIFTSGTTGVPKGVEIGYYSFANYLIWAAKNYANDCAVDMPLYSSLAFDLTLTSIFLPLITGGKIVVYTQVSQAAQLEILDVFREDQVDIVKLTPSHLRLALRTQLRQLNPLESDRRLKSLILGGEDLPRSLAIDAQEHISANLLIYNEYGPTEATIGSMIHQFNPISDVTPSVPIGKPIKNSEVYVLDKCGQPTPEGFAGSMYLGGATLAIGYRNGAKIAGALYSTGDNAYRLPDNNLVYLGRGGSQIKFRGARIELDEIKSALLANETVDNAHIVLSQRQSSDSESHCSQCGISSTVPKVDINSSGVCNICQDFESKKKQFDLYFKDLNQLKTVLSERNSNADKAACLVLASGGKDSSYMLCKLVEMGFKPIVFTLDNGYLSAHALENVEQMTQRFGLSWIRECPDAMNSIFADSLRRHSNVCDGCFKTIYTLAINYALAHGISSIVTGLSRGQLFETRLLDMANAEVYDEKEIDQRVSMARIAYHQIQDAVSEHLDVSACLSPESFSKISFIDFYRYCDVSLDEMLDFLTCYGGWKRPPDTGRSTNCLINDVGIYVHKHERFFHNYAIPYAWDVRLNHKTRLQAVDELNDDIDESRVKKILADINYTPIETQEATEQQLIAYYTLSKPITDSVSYLREYLSGCLPDYAIPTAFVELTAMPLNTSGKINSLALPPPIHQSGSYESPRNSLEEKMVRLWQEVFDIKRVGIGDNFFDLGGDSITAVQLSLSAKNAGILFSPADLFNHPTIIEIAEIANEITETIQAKDFNPDSGLDDDELSELLARVSISKNSEGSS